MACDNPDSNVVDDDESLPSSSRSNSTAELHVNNSLQLLARKIAIIHIVFGILAFGVAFHGIETDTHSCRVAVGIWGGPYFQVLGVLLLNTRFKGPSILVHLSAIGEGMGILISLIFFLSPIFDYCNEGRYAGPISVVYWGYILVHGLLGLVHVALTFYITWVIWSYALGCQIRSLNRSQSRNRRLNPHPSQFPITQQRTSSRNTRRTTSPDAEMPPPSYDQLFPPLSVEEIPAGEVGDPTNLCLMVSYSKQHDTVL